MKKQIFKKLAVLPVIALFVLFTVITAAPVSRAYAATAPTAISVTYYDGVYTRGFTWRTDQTVTSGQVQIVEKTGSMTKASFNDWSDTSVVTTVTAASSGLPSGATGDTANTKVWKADYNFTSAAGEKEYLYRVGSPQGWSATGEQKIDGGENGVYLIHTTDPQGGYVSWKRTVEKAYEMYPDTQNMINTGDLTDIGNNVTHWNSVFNEPRSTLMDTVFTPVSGNHDGDGRNPQYNGFFAAHFNIYTPPAPAQANTGLWYSYDIGNVNITVLNTQDPLANSSVSTVQLDWFKANLASANSRGVEWKIVALHVALASTGAQSVDPSVDLLRAQLMPVMAAYKVDLVLQGHDHVYARSNPLLWSDTGGRTAAGSYETVSETFFGPEREYMTEPGGTAYVNINTAGDKQYAANYGNSLPEFLRPGTNAIATNPLNNQPANAQPDASMFGAISIKDSVLLYESYTVNRNTGAIALYDYYGVIKDLHNVPLKIPTINAQPQGASATAGETVSFSVTALSNDDGTLNYQWYGNTVNSNKGGVAIAGAVNATYTFTADAMSYQYYYAVVTNRLGLKTASVTSNVVKLAVTIPPDIETSGGGGCGGESPSALSMFVLLPGAVLLLLKRKIT